MFPGYWQLKINNSLNIKIPINLIKPTYRIASQFTVNNVPNVIPGATIKLYTTLFDHKHLQVINSTFSISEFASAWKQSEWFLCYFLSYSYFKILQSQWHSVHWGINTSSKTPPTLFRQAKLSTIASPPHPTLKKNNKFWFFREPP